MGAQAAPDADARSDLTTAVPAADGSAIETDAIVIGAGPVGLFQVFELGLQEIKAHVVDSLPQAGGQCIELYPDKPIYDIPALAACSARELVRRLLRQIEPMGAVLHLGQEVAAVAPQADGRFLVQTSTGTRLLGRVIVIAGGAGSFQPRRLKLDGLDAFEGLQLHYHVSDPAVHAGQRLVIVGGGDAALDCALHFAQRGPQQARSVVLVHRRDVLQAEHGRVETMRSLCAAGAMRFMPAQVSGIEQQAGRLTAVQLTGADGATRTEPLDALLVLQGLSPRLGPIAEWGLALYRRQLVVDTERFQTSVPGIYAVGDINTYPGKQKLIVCGFHEAALASFAAAAHVFRDKRIRLEYTTTSTRLHKVLGVQPAAEVQPQADAQPPSDG